MNKKTILILLGIAVFILAILGIIGIVIGLAIIGNNPVKNEIQSTILQDILLSNTTTTTMTTTTTTVRSTTSSTSSIMSSTSTVSPTTSTTSIVSLSNLKKWPFHDPRHHTGETSD